MQIRRLRAAVVSIAIVPIFGVLAAQGAHAAQPSPRAPSTIAVPTGLLAGMMPTGPADGAQPLRIAVELQPRDPRLETLAAAMLDPTAPEHRHPLARAAFVQRFARPTADRDAVEKFLRANGVADLLVSSGGLVLGGVFTVADAERAFHVRFSTFTAGTRTAIAPTGPLTLPIGGIRAVRGVVAAITPRLAQTAVATPFTNFRGDWYPPARFRDFYDAAPDGGRDQRIALIEDASDRFDQRDLAPFLANEGPPGASAARVHERAFAFKAASGTCGRDDRGQEPTIDVAATLTLAPAADIDIRYDDVCSLGNDGTLALERALDADPAPTVIVFPFTVAPLFGTVANAFGSIPIPLLEAAVRGIPIVVPSGDDGPYGMHVAGLDRPAVAYPCVSTYVVCAGGTQVGDRNGAIDEGPWNDGVHASGGGISIEPRPAWQNVPSDFAFNTDAVRNRMVPDVGADASGHLRVYWRQYNIGGVGGTSESAALIAASLATINAAVAPEHRLLTASDLYVLANTAPTAFRATKFENDRAKRNNTLETRASPLPKGYRGPIPTAAPTVAGCTSTQRNGCSIVPTGGYNPVTGLGSLQQRAAIDALK